MKSKKSSDFVELAEVDDVKKEEPETSPKKKITAASSRANSRANESPGLSVLHPGLKRSNAILAVGLGVDFDDKDVIKVLLLLPRHKKEKMSANEVNPLSQVLDKANLDTLAEVEEINFEGLSISDKAAFAIASIIPSLSQLVLYSSACVCLC